MTACSSLGAGVGVEGWEIAAACLRVLTLDMLPYRCVFGGLVAAAVACLMFADCVFGG